MKLSKRVKLMLLLAVELENVRPGQLAEKMGKMQQEMTRLLNPDHATKIDTIAEALDVLGYEIEMKLVRRQS